MVLQTHAILTIGQAEAKKCKKWQYDLENRKKCPIFAIATGTLPFLESVPKHDIYPQVALLL